MQIISFTGKSGTGKSYNANRIAMQENIDAIIDDGLLIYKGQVVAGTSAKKSNTKAGAVKTALFKYEDNRKTVKRALKKYKPNKLMIIGTSDRMVDIIVDSLDLSGVDRRIYIEDVTTEEEREKASYSRNTDGQHIIPVPIGKLKRDFAGYFLNPMKYFKAMLEDGQNSKPNEAESTVVRPRYSYYGTFTISAQVVRDIVRIAAWRFSTALHVCTVIERGKESNIMLSIEIKMLKSTDVKTVCTYLQQQIYQTIENMTAFSVKDINIKIVGMADNVAELHEKETLWKELL